jgi:hypothetical protein
MKGPKASIAVAMLAGGFLFFAGGCGGKKNPIDGQYQDAKSSMLTMDFHSGDCDISFAGMTKHCTYEINGNTVILRRSNDTVVEMTLTRNADGSMTDHASGNNLLRTSR